MSPSHSSVYSTAIFLFFFWTLALCSSFCWLQTDEAPSVAMAQPVSPRRKDIFHRLNRILLPVSENREMSRHAFKRQDYRCREALSSKTTDDVPQLRKHPSASPSRRCGKRTQFDKVALSTAERPLGPYRTTWSQADRIATISVHDAFGSCSPPLSHFNGILLCDFSLDSRKYCSSLEYDRAKKIRLQKHADLEWIR